MDFVISKVAMSICALLVVSVLGSAFGEDFFVKNHDEMASVLADLSQTLEHAALSTCTGTTRWTVPCLADGSRMEVKIASTGLIARSGGRTCELEMASPVHTWLWDGSVLNRTTVEALDAASSEVRSQSGQWFEVTTKMVTYENGATMFVFVRSGSSDSCWRSRSGP